MVALTVIISSCDNAEPILVDYSLTLEQMKNDYNCYSLLIDKSKSVNTVDTTIKVFVKLYKLRSDSDTKHIVEKMSKDGFRPAKIHELIAYNHDDTDITVVSLGTSFGFHTNYTRYYQSFSLVPSITNHRLNFICGGDFWVAPDDYSEIPIYFLAVKE